MAHLSVKHFSPFKKSFSPSRRHCRHFASRFLATFNSYLPANFYFSYEGSTRDAGRARALLAEGARSPRSYTRRRLGGRQPLCGTGVTSDIDEILKPTAFSARTADSRPGPGPLIRTSRFLTPDSWASLPARSAATCAAKGVDLREPLKPLLPHVAQASVLPWRSVIVTIVLLKEA